MIHINEVPLDFEPRKKILSKIPAFPPEPEMSEVESAFLCGAIKKHRPKKILEVGVAGGATTAIILQTLEDIGESYEMHSVDLSEKFYRQPKLNTGFMAAFAKENNLITPPGLPCAVNIRFGSEKFCRKSLTLSAAKLIS